MNGLAENESDFVFAFVFPFNLCPVSTNLYVQCTNHDQIHFIVSQSYNFKFTLTKHAERKRT